MGARIWNPRMRIRVLRAMRLHYTDVFVLPLPEGHRFPMEKYRLLREAVRIHLPDATLVIPDGATDEELLSVHAPGYLDRVIRGTLERAEVRRIGFPWSPGLVERSRRSVGATLAATEVGLDEGVSVNLAGGTHHAFRDRGEGFCVFNDVAVAIETWRGRGRLRRAAVLDLDVHQGNGTAAIFREDPETFTASVHGAANFPFRKERSDLDIALPDGTPDGPYLEAVREAAMQVRDRGRPDVVYYLAGADAFAGDRLGRLGVSKAGLAERDRIVVEALDGIPLVVVMGGGYAEDVHDTVEIHLHSIITAATGVGRPPRPRSPSSLGRRGSPPHGPAHGSPGG